MTVPSKGPPGSASSLGQAIADIDIEKALQNGTSMRKMALYAPVYNGLAAAISLGKFPFSLNTISASFLCVPFS
jgi:hypothetical protein